MVSAGPLPRPARDAADRLRLTPHVVAALTAVLVAAGPSLAAAQDTTVPADARISLSRTACFGECPVYTVTIDATGQVTYEGTRFVRVTGPATARVPVTDVRALLDTAARIGFFDLEAQYRTITHPDGSVESVTDLPTTIVTVTRDGRTHRVEDYFGAPDALRDFERQIDRIAGTARWIRNGGPTP